MTGSQPVAPARGSLGLLLVVLLAACQSAERAQPKAALQPAWRVVERSGEARVREAGEGWLPVVPGGEIAGAAMVTTGGGGRLILVRPGIQIAAGTDSAFALPVFGLDQPLRQDAGRLRYRVMHTGDDPFVVETPLLRVQASAAVFDLVVGPGSSEVTVDEGRLLVATLDRSRGATLDAGHTAEVRAREGTRLMVRQDASLPSVAVELDVVAATSQVATMAMQGVARGRVAQPAGPLPGLKPRSAPAAEPTALPAGYRPAPERVPAEDAHEGANAPTPDQPGRDSGPVVDRPAPQAIDIDQRQQDFAPLTSGLLDALAPAWAQVGAPAHGPRSF